MVTSVGVLPPFEDHPFNINYYKIVYIAVIVYVIVCFFGPITGAHINPAISLGINLNPKKRKGNIKMILCYWSAQFIGGLLGVILSHNIYGNGHPPFEVMPETVDLLKYCAE